MTDPFGKCLEPTLCFVSFDLEVVIPHEKDSVVILLNQECSSFEESKSFVFDGRLKVLDIAEVL